jgi:hypothetical protein
MLLPSRGRCVERRRTAPHEYEQATPMDNNLERCQALPRFDHGRAVALGMTAPRW